MVGLLVFLPDHEEAKGVVGRKNEISGGTKSTMNSSEAGPVGLGVPKEAGKPGPFSSQSLWTASCQNLGSAMCWWI